MGKYLINGSKYEIDDSIQGDDLTKTLQQLAGQTADPRGSKIDSYLAQTDSMLGLTPGTSARQINQESNFRDDAVSRAGAQGLAQVMPATAATLSERFGRKLDPRNTDDALLMHRELMRENMAKFGNEADALRAYNAGWDRNKWDNDETRNYVQRIALANTQSQPSDSPSIEGAVAAQSGQTAAPFSKVRQNVDPATLKDDQDWVRASKSIYSLRERQSFTGSDADAAEWGKSVMGFFNNNLVQMTRYAHDVITNGTEEDKKAFLYMMNTYDNTVFSWEGAGRAAEAIAKDPTTYVGIGTLGAGTGAKIIASAAAKQGLKKALMTAVGRTGIVAGIQGGLYGGVQDTIKQSIELSADAKQGFDLTELATHTGIGVAAGAVLGTVADAAATKIINVVRGGIAKRAEAKAGARAAAEPAPVLAKAEPVPAAEAEATAAALGEPAPLVGKSEPVPAAGEPAGPELVPSKVLTDAEIAEATARKQKGRLAIDDEPPVTAANPEAAAQIEVPDVTTGLRSTPRSMAELTKDGEVIAGQLRSLDDETMHGVLESFRGGEYTLEESRVIARGVQIHADELRIEQAEIIKKLGLSTNAQETTQLVERLGQVEKRLTPLDLADDAFGSLAGSMLRQRQEGLQGLQGVTVESLMADRGISREAAEETFVRLVEGSKQSAEAQKIAASYEERITAANDAGDMTEVAKLTAMKYRELSGVVEKEIPGSASFMDKALELAISNVFTPTTVAINLIPAGIKTMVLPAMRSLLQNPLEAASRAEMSASYSAMSASVGSAWRAAAAAFKYEQSMLTRGTGRLLEGELAMTGKTGGALRFFPRILNATDEFLAHLNYNAFISGKAAAEAAVDGAAKGLKGKELSQFIKDASESAVKEAFTQPSGEALIQPVVNKGVNLGLTGEELQQYVEREAVKSAEALRHGNNEEALDYVKDVLYKRALSGEGNASKMALAYESAMNKVPSAKLILGQLFFRTPIRVFEEGIRMTPGLQIVAPNFIADLAGKNGMLRQVRAQGESLTSLAILGGVMTLYASGRITGDGAYDNWKQGRTQADGPGQPAYTIKMSDGSTWSYRNFDPVATPVKIIINGLERMDRLAIRQSQGEYIDKSAWDKAQAYLHVGLGAIASSIRDANLVAGLDQTIKLGENLADPEGKEDAWLKWFAEKMSLLVPNTLHKISKENDPTMKDPADFWQVVQTRLHVDPKDDIKTSLSYDVLGNARQITDTGTLWNVFSTASAEERAKGHSPEAQRVMLELDRLQKETNAVFTPPLKNHMTGAFDLRTTLTADKTETLYDRWQRNFRSLDPDKILYPVVTAEMPDGTFKHKAARVETVQKILGELHDASFKMTMAQEQKVMDVVIKQEIDSAKAKAGLFDFSNRNK